MDMPVEANPDIRILRAGLRDLNAVRGLERVSFPQDAWPLLEMVGVLSLPSIERWKAMDRERLAGFVAADVRRVENVAWIATIAVHPDYRRQGLGGRLMAHVEARVPSRAMRLSARASNQEAIRLYQGRGYQQIDVWPRYYRGGEDAVVMEKVLAANSH